MMRYRDIRAIRTALFLSILPLLGACAGDETGDSDDTPEETTAPDKTSFSADIMPLLDACVSCHSSGAGGWYYDGSTNAYEAVKSTVNLDDPANSDLLLNTAGIDHAGGVIYAASSDEYQTLLTWIEEGAPNN